MKVKEWRKKNPEKLAEQKLRYRSKNKLKINASWRDWYKRSKLKEIAEDKNTTDLE